MPYLTLDPGRILATIAKLRQRIEERFPTSGLAEVCAELEKLGAKAEATSEELARPRLAQRFSDGVVLSSVNEVEDLTTGLSRKIWQKLMILEQLGRESHNA